MNNGIVSMGLGGDANALSQSRNGLANQDLVVVVVRENIERGGVAKPVKPSPLFKPFRPIPPKPVQVPENDILSENTQADSSNVNQFNKRIAERAEGRANPFDATETGFDAPTSRAGQSAFQIDWSDLELLSIIEASTDDYH